jgi:hypothetical protein
MLIQKVSVSYSSGAKSSSRADDLAIVRPTQKSNSASSESFCLYLPELDGSCFEQFLERLGEAYADHWLVLVLDNAPSHISKEIEHPQNVSLLPTLPS